MFGHSYYCKFATSHNAQESISMGFSCGLGHFAQLLFNAIVLGLSVYAVYVVWAAKWKVHDMNETVLMSYKNDWYRAHKLAESERAKIDTIRAPQGDLQSITHALP